MLYTETVETGTLDLIKRLMADEVFNHFNLVGGTALSLKLGHRKSIDIDLFTIKDFDAYAIKQHLKSGYAGEKMMNLKNAVFGFVNNVKIDLLAHKYPTITPVEVIDGIRMLSLEDLGAMKLHAIIQNGTRLKDFVDVHFILQHRSLNQLTEALVSKYPDTNRHMATAALLYHKDIDFTVPITLTTGELHWKKVEERLREAVSNSNKIFMKQEFGPQEQGKESLKNAARRRPRKRPEL